MADITWSVRIDEDIKNRITEIISNSNQSAKDFFVKMLETKETETIKKGLPNQKTIENLQHHQKRIEEIFLETSKTTNDQIITHTETIDQLKSELQQAKLTAQKKTEEADRKIKESLETIIKAKEETREEMTNLKDRAKKAEQIANEVKTSSHRLEKEIEDLRNQITDLRADRDRKRTAKETTQAENKTLQQLQTKTTNEISKLKAQINEKDKAIVLAREETRKETQKESNIIVEKLQNQTEQQQKATQKQIEQLQTELRTLHKEKDKLWSQYSEIREQKAKLEKTKPSKNK